jgi:hypothetical protein
MADVVRESGLKRLSRLVCARARAAGIDVAPLMVKAGVTRQQVEDDSVWLTVQGQIRFVELVANALQDDFLGFHVAQSFDLREMGLLYLNRAVDSSGSLIRTKSASKSPTVTEEGFHEPSTRIATNPGTPQTTTVEGLSRSRYARTIGVQ